MKKFVLAVALSAMAPLTIGMAHAQLSLPMAAKPEEVGLSSEQLRKLEAVTKAHIDEGLVPGAVMLVARRGKVAWVSVQGKREPGSADPMKLDSIFRIYSMTKPIVSVAAMSLFEEGRLMLGDPVSKYVPEFAQTTAGVVRGGDIVRVPLEAATGVLKTVPLARYEEASAFFG